MADSGLGNVEPLGRPGEIQAVGHLHKTLQLCSIHQDLPDSAAAFCVIDVINKILL